nr:unnamed protein product [Callosobruchus analis]
MSRYSSSFENLFALFGFSMLTWVHARGTIWKRPQKRNPARNSK